MFQFAPVTISIHEHQLCGSCGADVFLHFAKIEFLEQ
jgi:hypothetical protein